MGQGPGTKRINAHRKASGNENARQWVALRIQGWSNRQIALKFDVAESTISQGIKRELSRPVEGLEELRVIESEKLDVRERKLRTAMTRIDADDTEALERVDRCLARVADRRARLFGLDTPVKVDPDLVVSTTAATAAATAAAVTEARAAAPAVQIILATEVGADEEG